MNALLKVLALAAIVLLDATAANAADCLCDQLSAEGCREGVVVRDEPASPPQWCERMDDPRCMPASPHGSSTPTVVPVAIGWAQPIRWYAPPRASVPLDLHVEGGERAQHARRIERPPR